MNYLADTNLLIRLLVREDEQQYEATVQALTRLEQSGETCYVPDIVWIEACWVLEKVYKLEGKTIADALISLLHTEVFAPLSGHVHEMLSSYAETRIDPTDLYLSALAISTGHSVITWNHKDFRKLACEWLTPKQIN